MTHKTNNIDSIGKEGCDQLNAIRDTTRYHFAIPTK